MAFFKQHSQQPPLRNPFTTRTTLRTNSHRGLALLPSYNNTNHTSLGGWKSTLIQFCFVCALGATVVSIVSIIAPFPTGNKNGLGVRDVIAAQDPLSLLQSTTLSGGGDMQPRPRVGGGVRGQSRLPPPRTNSADSLWNGQKVEAEKKAVNTAERWDPQNEPSGDNEVAAEKPDPEDKIAAPVNKFIDDAKENVKQDAQKEADALPAGDEAFGRESKEHEDAANAFDSKGRPAEEVKIVADSKDKDVSEKSPVTVLKQAPGESKASRQEEKSEPKRIDEEDLKVNDKDLDATLESPGKLATTDTTSNEAKEKGVKSEEHKEPVVGGESDQKADTKHVKENKIDLDAQNSLEKKERELDSLAKENEIKTGTVDKGDGPSEEHVSQEDAKIAIDDKAKTESTPDAVKREAEKDSTKHKDRSPILVDSGKKESREAAVKDSPVHVDSDKVESKQREEIVKEQR